MMQKAGANVLADPTISVRGAQKILSRVVPAPNPPTRHLPSPAIAHVDFRDHPERLARYLGTHVTELRKSSLSYEIRNSAILDVCAGGDSFKLEIKCVSQDIS
jgi:hypothetical protein